MQNKSEWFEKKYKRSLDDLKKEIASRIIDLNGYNHETLLVREIRGCHDLIITHHHEDDPRGKSNQKRFWYEFSLVHYSVHPDAPGFRTDRNGEYIADKEIMDMLVKDIVEGIFSDRFDEFIRELYNWSLEVD
jgi:hypothetical protein